jgi:drug/metabolite transporter (DMT)-like permease
MAVREYKNAVLLTVLASLIWGTSFPGALLGLKHAGNDVFFLWLRFAVATVITLTLVLAYKKFSFSVMREPAIWIIGGFNAVGFILQYVGLNFTSASKTALLVDINVVYLAGWSWAFFIVLSKKMMRKYNGIQISSGAILSCTLFLVPAVLYVYLAGADMSLDSWGWVGVLYLGLFCTSIATLLWALGLEGVSATASATIMLVEVVTALVISFSPLLNETLQPIAIVGAFCVLAAIYLVAAPSKVEVEPVKPT